jgi:hypothetical protein
MKRLKDYIYESIDFINEGSAEDKEMKKWLKQNGAKKMKVVNGEVVLVGKTGTSFNELKLQPNVEELPDFVKFQKDEFSCTLELEGKSLKTLKGFPAPGPAAHLELYNCTSLKDFDIDLSNSTGGATIELHDCTNLESLSGFKTAKKSSSDNGLYIYNSPKLKSLKDLKDFPNMSIRLENVGIYNLEGYPTQEENYTQEIKITGAHNLVSLDGYHSKSSPRVIEFRDCPKLSKVGDMSFTKKKEVEFIYFINCPKVDDAFLEELLGLCKIEDDNWGKLVLVNTGVKADSDVIKRFKEKYPSKPVEFE